MDGGLMRRVTSTRQQVPQVFFDRWFDDLRVGDEFESSERLVTHADIDLFSALTERICLQDRSGPGSTIAGPYRGLHRRIVSGLVSLFAAADLVVLNPQRLLAIRELTQLRILEPVRHGDGIKIHARLTALRRVDAGRGLVSCNSQILNQSDRTVALAVLELLWRRSSPVLPAADGGDDEWQLAAEMPV